jgi:catechol 2,3-dioxygenase-like lactoylglutathione lyase family enzyme
MPENATSPVRGQVTGSVHTGFHVSDLERSLRFYVDLLGLRLRLRRTVAEDYVRRLVGQPGAVLDQAFVDIPGSEHFLELIEYRKVSGTPVDPTPANAGTAHLCLIVDDVRAVHERLGNAGVRFTSEPVMPTVGPNRGRLAVYLEDPDGIRIELLQAEPVAGEDQTTDEGVGHVA